MIDTLFSDRAANHQKQKDSSCIEAEWMILSESSILLIAASLAYIFLVLGGIPAINYNLKLKFIEKADTTGAFIQLVKELYSTFIDQRI